MQTVELRNWVMNLLHQEYTDDDNEDITWSIETVDHDRDDALVLTLFCEGEVHSGWLVTLERAYTKE